MILFVALGFDLSSLLVHFGCWFGCNLLYACFEFVVDLGRHLRVYIYDLLWFCVCIWVFAFAGCPFACLSLLGFRFYLALLLFAF